MLAGYPHFLRTAASLQWDEGAVDLRADAREWPLLAADDRRRVTRLVAGFCFGEEAVAGQLGPFGQAAVGAQATACFQAQAVDEARHARFFDRFAREVIATPGRDSSERTHALRGWVEPPFLDLFEETLPEAAAALSRGARSLDAAVALYHMVLEGVVFTAGQLALLELLEGIDSLPGLCRGLELVVRDENWHMGFGARCLQDLGLSATAASVLASEAECALGAWGDAVPAHLTLRVARLHGRRLGAAGLARGRVAA